MLVQVSFLRPLLAQLINYYVLEKNLTLPWRPHVTQKSTKRFLVENAIKHLTFNFSFAQVLEGI